MTNTVIPSPGWFISLVLAVLAIITVLEFLTILPQLRKASKALSDLPGGTWGGVAYSVAEAALMVVPAAAFLALCLQLPKIVDQSGWTIYVVAFLGWGIFYFLGKWVLRSVSPWFMRVYTAVNALPSPL